MRPVLRITGGLLLALVGGFGPAGARPAGSLDADAATGFAGADGQAGDAGVDAPDTSDPDPVMTAAEQAALQVLSPAALPPPPADITNAFADSAAAAAFGQELFYDKSFSGQLLDTDNDGARSRWGWRDRQGASLAPDVTFRRAGSRTRARSSSRISLGAGWGRRRAPSLLDVGQARLLMWDGRHDALYSQPFGPLETVVEMNSSRLYMAEQLYASYQADYEAVFGPMPPLGDAAQFPPLSATLTGRLPMNSTDPTDLRRPLPWLAGRRRRVRRDERPRIRWP